MSNYDIFYASALGALIGKLGDDLSLGISPNSVSKTCDALNGICDLADFFAQRGVENSRTFDEYEKREALRKAREGTTLEISPPMRDTTL